MNLAFLQTEPYEQWEGLKELNVQERLRLRGKTKE